MDVSYGGENGFNQAIELSADALSNVKFIQEKKLIGRQLRVAEIYLIRRGHAKSPLTSQFSNLPSSFLLFVFLLAGKYFDEISQDTGRYCFNVNDTLKALEMGAVETLIVWENLEVTRYVLKDHSTDSERDQP